MRHEPPNYHHRRRRIKREPLPWEIDMTLCMAASCVEQDGESRIVAWTDTRVEGEGAGSNSGYKYEFIKTPGWRALIAGEISKARDLAATFREVLDASELHGRNIFDKLNEASGAHNLKLRSRLVQNRLGISFERFVKTGEHEVDQDTRRRIWYELDQLNFGCALIVFGFIDGIHLMYSIDELGEVTNRPNFVAIGTGGVIAESNLHFREQMSVDSVERTIYNLYESHRIAVASKAPGVGETPNAIIYGPPKDEELNQEWYLTPKCLTVLSSSFRKYGPKVVGPVPSLTRHLKAKAEIPAWIKKLQATPSKKRLKKPLR
jgi:hypothetical protein